MKSIAYLIFLALIASIALFSGCVEEENTASMETPAADVAPTSTPEQEAVPTPTQNTTPEQETVLPTPTPEAVELPALEPGYEWYQDDELGYKIAYPEDWKTGTGTSGTISALDIYPQGYTSIYGEEESLSSYVSITVRVNSNQTFFRFWETGVLFGLTEVPIGLEELKEQGRIIEYKDITVNGKDGLEVVFDTIVLYSGSEGLAPPSTTQYVLFTNDDLDYIISTNSNNAFYDEYKDTFEYVINSFIID